ncbi:hypothetical protein ACVW1A_005453 [Bradyrhizobium sp. LB1.3]
MLAVSSMKFLAPASDMGPTFLDLASHGIDDAEVFRVNNTFG